MEVVKAVRLAALPAGRGPTGLAPVLGLDGCVLATGTAPSTSSLRIGPSVTAPPNSGGGTCGSWKDHYHYYGSEPVPSGGGATGSECTSVAPQYRCSSTDSTAGEVGVASSTGY